MDEVVQIISTLGFPIAACIGMGWYVYQQGKSHKEEINALREAVDNNTKVTTELNTMMGMIWEALKDR